MTNQMMIAGLGWTEFQSGSGQQAQIKENVNEFQIRMDSHEFTCLEIQTKNTSKNNIAINAF